MTAQHQIKVAKEILDYLDPKIEELNSEELAEVNSKFTSIGFTKVRFNQILPTPGAYGIEYIGHTVMGEILPIKTLMDSLIEKLGAKG